MSTTVRKVNAFFRKAKKADIDKVLGEVVLSARQKKVFDMYYIQKHDVGFIADTLNISYSVIKSEILAVRQKIFQTI